MSVFLHMTKFNKWIERNPPWLSKGEIPADPLFGLGVQTPNQMSAWEVDESVRNLEEIAAGLAAGRREWKDFEYLLLDSETLTEIGIKVKRTQGRSCDQKLTRLHRDLTEISAQKAVKLAAAIVGQLNRGYKKINRILKKTMAGLIWAGIQEGRIDPSLVEPKVLENVNKMVGRPSTSS